MTAGTEVWVEVGQQRPGFTTTVWFRVTSLEPEAGSRYRQSGGPAGLRDLRFNLMAERPRRRFAKRVPVAPGKAPQLEKPVGHGDVRHGGPGLGRSERRAGSLEALAGHVLFRTDAGDVVERRTQRPLADPGDPAQFGDGDYLAEVVAKKGVDALDDFGTWNPTDE